MKTIVLVSLLVIYLDGNCQVRSSHSLNDKLTDLKGEPLLAGNATYEDGSPFYSTDFQRGTLILNNGKKYSDILVKLNLMNDKIHYQQQDGKTERVTSADIVRDVSFIDPEQKDTVHFRSRYPAISKNDLKTFYLVLADGKMQLLKQMKRVLIEEKNFNSATITRRFDTEKGYFIFINGQMQKIKRTKSSVLELIEDEKKGKVEQFISDNGLTVKGDSDFAKIVSYYNSL